METVPALLLLTAKQTSTETFRKCAGKHEDPLSDLPRWRLEALIGGPIRNMSLFRQALTAPAALPEGQELASYERLEFLGDAVLELAIREHLFTRSAPTVLPDTTGLKRSWPPVHGYERHFGCCCRGKDRVLRDQSMGFGLNIL